jgi:hypothetical protein
MECKGKKAFRKGKKASLSGRKKKSAEGISVLMGFVFVSERFCETLFRFKSGMRQIYNIGGGVNPNLCRIIFQNFFKIFIAI